ncbi:MAG: family 16 glycosylhydrolase, partial [Bacteroidota bacterium]
MNKKILSILLVFTVFLRVVSQINPVLLQLRTDTAIKWNYFFGDEFNKGDIDDEKWHRGYPWGGLFVIEDEWADPAFLKFNPNGILEFNADKSNELRKFPDWMIDSNQLKKHEKKLVDGKYQLKYKGSAIWSKEPIKYGYFECRCKMPPGKGLWPAFWLYGGNPNDEIDFMELKGEKPNEIHIDVHCPDNCDKGYPGFMGIKKNWGAWAKVNSDLTKDWNIVSGIWMPGYVMFFLNGQVLACFKGDFKNSMNVIANLAIAVDNGPFGPGINDKTPLPAKMEVDYIRVWKVPEDVAFAERRIRIADPDLSPKNNKVTFG